MSFRGHLPSGAVTKNWRKYAKEWRQLADDVEAVLGLGFKPLGYEPGILFRRDGGPTLSLPTDVCLAIAKHAPKKAKK